MPTPATTTLPDMHREPAAHPPRLGQLVLILVPGAHMIDLPAALTPRLTRSIELLINLLGRLTMSMPAVLATRPTTRATRIPRRLAARERRRLTLARTSCLLQLALEFRDRPPQPLVLSRQRRAPRLRSRQLIHQLDRTHLNL
jgi:hypothetical protein